MSIKSESKQRQSNDRFRNNWDWVFYAKWIKTGENTAKSGDRAKSDESEGVKTDGLEVGA